MESPEIKVEESPVDESLWMQKINEEVAAKAQVLADALGCAVEPAIFVITPLEDIAIVFLRKPDALQSFKILRLLGENYEQGVIMAAKAQIIREHNGEVVSDPRFMDVDGKYDPEYSDLNLSLLLKIQRLVRPYQDQFKKK